MGCQCIDVLTRYEPVSLKGSRPAVPGEAALSEIFELLYGKRTTDPSGYFRYQHWRIYRDEGLISDQAHLVAGVPIQALAEQQDIAVAGGCQRQHPLFQVCAVVTGIAVGDGDGVHICLRLIDSAHRE